MQFFLRDLGPDAAGNKAHKEFFARRQVSDKVADDEAFLNPIADIYYTCVVGELRKCDPHHLVLGDRFKAGPERTPDSILITASKYVDAISFQPMGTREPIREYLDHVFAITGKPVLLADVNTMPVRPQKDQTDTTEYERAAGEHTLKYYTRPIEVKYRFHFERDKRQ